MPRRRMIDPEFWNDGKIKKLTPIERLLFIGMISYADDEGRLLADTAYLRSKVFPYDDFTLEQIQEMRDQITKMDPNVLLYQNGDEEYLCFTKWGEYQKPSHPQPSKLPPPSLDKLPEPFTELHHEIVHESITEQETPSAGMTPSQVSQGQSSQVKDRIVKGEFGIVQEDFTEFLDSEKDLTDFLTTTLEKYIPAGRPTHVMPVIRKLWIQATGKEISSEVFQLFYASLPKYPIPVLAKTLVKAVKYSPGKTKPAKYIQTVFDEQMETYSGKNSAHNNSS